MYGSTQIDITYDPEFPEKYNWDKIDSPKVNCIANSLSKAIKADLKTDDRNLVPGLRTALRTIANELIRG